MKLTVYDAVAYIVAIIVSALMAAITLAIKFTLTDPQGFSSPLGWVPVFFVFCVIPICLIAPPVYFFLKTKSKDTLVFAIFIGVVAEALMGLIFTLPQKPEFGDLLALSPAGAIASVFFWGVMTIVKKILSPP